MSARYEALSSMTLQCVYNIMCAPLTIQNLNIHVCMYLTILASILLSNPY